MSLKKYPGKFYEEPLDGFFILCRERGDVIMWHVPFRKSLMRGSQKHLAVKRDHGVPIAKLNFIKNRGQICPLFDFIYLLSFSFIASKKFLIVSFFSVFAFASTM